MNKVLLNLVLKGEIHLNKVKLNEKKEKNISINELLQDQVSNKINTTINLYCFMTSKETINY